MKMKKIAVAVALWFAAAASHADFVDNRKTDAVIDVNYKSIAVEELVDDIVPDAFQVSYAKPELRKKLLKVSGKGTWQQLLTQAAGTGNVVVHVDLPGRRVQIGELAAVAATPVAGSPAAAASAAPVASVKAAKPATAAAAAPAGNAVVTVVTKPVQTWSVTVADRSVRTLLERWAKTAGYQMSWEIPVDLELNANANMTGSFEDALTAVLASLKNSEYPIETIIYDNNVVRMVKRTPRNK
jgi:hypothetical protein